MANFLHQFIHEWPLLLVVEIDYPDFACRKHEPLGVGKAELLTLRYYWFVDSGLEESCDWRGPKVPKT